MIEVYKVYDDDKNEHVANLYYNQETKQYSSEITSENNTMILFAKLDHGIIWRGDPHPEGIYIENWLKSRVIPENRQMLKEILLANGIHEYDWRVLIKLNHGKSVCDSFRVEVTKVTSLEELNS